MPPPKQPHNPLLQPLNDILGTQANVRLLRVLTRSSVPLTAGELAKRAELGRTSIYPALHALERIGMIEFVGAGAHRQVQLRERHPFTKVLRQLFRTEVRRFEELIAGLRQLVMELRPRPMSAWIDEKARDAQSDNTLRLSFVAKPEEVEPLTDYFNSRLTKVEHAYDIHIPVAGLTRSELESLYGRQPNSLSEAILLDGAPPIALLGPSPSARRSQTLRSHEEHDARSRKLALAIATKIKRDPGLVHAAQDRLERRAAKASPGERRELAEWLRIFSGMSAARLRRFLIEDSERAIRLRQSLPALNLLSPAERDAVIRSRTDADVIKAVTR